MERLVHEVNISIPKSDVVQRVRVKAAYKAGKAAGDSQETYDKIEIASSDALIIDKYWTESETSITNLLEDYCDTVELLNTTSLDYKVKLVMPGGWDAGKEAMLKEAITEYMVNCVLYKWYEVTAPKSVEFYVNECAMKGSEVVKLLSARLKPMRKFTQRQNSTISIS